MPKTNITYLALGDSYTVGESVPEMERFPEQLIDGLKLKGITTSVHHLIAKTGWTVSELEAGISKRKDLLKSYDLVTILIGVNDQFRGFPVSDYKISFPGIMKKALQFVGGDKNKILVISIPDYAFTPFGGGKKIISEGVDAYNAVNENICKALGIRRVDITEISRKGLRQPDLVAEDNLHPSDKQYKLWVDVILKQLPEIRFTDNRIDLQM
ncbi:MAG: SGNH/GDSL hydrolase family protein [Cyclobacteriaceae bacterium]|nr:SGNH/GDSL hydrolase family protein [Cyclobacteriaceae bacterium]